jgi:predicted metal-dependent phosphoesterase TrpH
VVTLVRRQGGLVYLPHPFDPGRSSLGAAAERLCAAGMADVIEVFNAKIEDHSRNEQAARLAAVNGLPPAAGSDAHDPEGIGAAYLDMPDFDGPAGFLDALGAAVITGQYRPHAIRYAREVPG